MFFIYILTLFFTLVFLQYITKFRYWKRRGVNGPTPIPLIGNSLESFLFDPKKVELRRRKKYGPVYGIYMGTKPMLSVCDPEIAKIVTVKEWQNFTDINVFKVKQKFFEGSFLLKKGKEWKEGRNMITPVFTTRKIKDIYPQIQKASKPFFENIENMINENKQDEIDIKFFSKGYSLDVIAKFVFAFELNSAKDQDHQFVVHARNLTNFKLWRMALFNMMSKYLIEKFGFEILERKSIDYIYDLVEALTNQRRQNKDIKYNDFLELLIDKIDAKNLDVSHSEIVSFCSIFFFAGIETVSMTISNVLLCMAMYPEYQERLYKELKETYPDGEIEYENLNDSKLLTAIIKESQRLYPALLNLIRIAEHPIEIKGLKIDAGQIVAVNVYNLHMDQSFWGENVKEFYPERFLEEGFQTEDSDHIHYVPFGSGPRSCVAKKMALVQVKYAVARTLMNYKVCKTEKTKIKFMKNPMALFYNQLLLCFTRRSDPNNN